MMSVTMIGLLLWVLTLFWTLCFYVKSVHDHHKICFLRYSYFTHFSCQPSLLLMKQVVGSDELVIKVFCHHSLRGSVKVVNRNVI